MASTRTWRRSIPSHVWERVSTRNARQAITTAKARSETGADSSPTCMAQARSSSSSCSSTGAPMETWRGWIWRSRLFLLRRRLSRGRQAGLGLGNHGGEARIVANGIEVWIDLGVIDEAEARSLQNRVKHRERGVPVAQLGRQHTGEIVAHEDIVGLD